MKIVPKGSKLIYAILFLLKPSWFLVFSFDSHLNTSHFSGYVHVGVASMIYFLKKYVYFKHVKSVLPEGLERRYFSVHIAIFYKVAIHSCKFFFCKLRHGIFCIFCFIFFLQNALF